MDIGDMDYLGYGHRTAPGRAPPGLLNFSPGALDLLDDLSDDDDDDGDDNFLGRSRTDVGSMDNDDVNMVEEVSVDALAPMFEGIR